TASSTTADSTAKRVVREAGTASPFQIPPRLARLPRVPSPGSARAAKVATSAVCAPRGSDDEALSIEAANHGSAAITALPNVRVAHSQRGRPAPGAATQASPIVAANINPVGVSPANAIQNASPKTRDSRCHPVSSADRSASIVVATQGRQP